MVQDKKTSREKNFSTAKSILAVLWHLKAASRESLFSHRYIKSLCQAKSKATFRSCLSRLCKEKLLKKEYNDIFVLTDNGQKKALFAFIDTELAFHSDEEARGKKWDGGWRIVFFDVPESKRKYRDYLRRVIRTIGFREFQRSIWIYPYPVPSFLKELLFEENIRSHVRFITTNLVDDDSDLRKVFRL